MGEKKIYERKVLSFFLFLVFSLGSWLWKHVQKVC